MNVSQFLPFLSQNDWASQNFLFVKNTQFCTQSWQHRFTCGISEQVVFFLGFFFPPVITFPVFFAFLVPTCLKCDTCMNFNISLVFTTVNRAKEAAYLLYWFLFSFFGAYAKNIALGQICENSWCILCSFKTVMRHKCYFLLYF